MNPDHIPDLHWKLANSYHTTNIGQSETMLATVSVHDITVETLSYAKSNNYGERCRTILNTKPATSPSKRDLTLCSIIPITKI